MNNEEYRKALSLARVASQDNPGFAIVDAMRGYARGPTQEEVLLGQALLRAENARKTLEEKYESPSKI